MWNLKNNTNDSIYKIETDPQTQKTNLWLRDDTGKGRRTNQEHGVNRYKLLILYIKQMRNKDLLYSTGNCWFPW